MKEKNQMILRKHRRRVKQGCCLSLLVLIAPFASAQVDGEEMGLDSLLSPHVSSIEKYEQAAREAPASVTIVTHEEIVEFGYRTLEDVLQSTPGFFISNTGEYTSVGVRGLGDADRTARILLMVDGHILNEPVSGSAPLGTDLGLSLDVVDHIEITRGPGSVAYGTGAMLAVVNLITRTTTSLNGCETSIAVGSPDRVALGTRMAVAANSHVETFINANGLLIDGNPSEPAATQSTPARDASYAFYGSFRGDPIRVSAIATSRLKHQAQFGSASGNADPAKDEMQFLDLQWQSMPSEDVSFDIRLGWDGYFRSSSLYSTERTTLRSALVRANGEAAWDIAADDKLVVGMEFRRCYDFSFTALDTANENVSYRDPFYNISTFADNEIEFCQSVRFQVGGRFDHFPGSDVITPRAALLWRPGQRCFTKLLYGEAFRLPSMIQSSANPGDPRWGGNSDLKPERIRTLEGIVEVPFGSGDLASLSLFTSRVTNLIDLAPGREMDVVRYNNTDAVNTAGGECSLSMRLSGCLVRGSYSYQQAAEGPDGEILRNSPHHLLKFSMRAPISDLLHASTELIVESSRNTFQGGSTGALYLLNATISTPWINDALCVAAHGYNLLNQKALSPADPWSSAGTVSREVRSLLLELDFRW